MKATIELSAIEVKEAIRTYLYTSYDHTVPEKAKGNYKIFFEGTVLSQPNPADSIIPLTNVSATVVYTV